MLLLLASFVICAAVGSLGAEATRVFFVALAMSTLLSAMPIAVLWFLDRRERESPWLFTSAFLWGGLIATTLALPVNSTVLYFVAQWLEGNAALKEMLGPEAALMIGAPIAAPLVEETTKGLGLLLLFWLVRSEFDNVRDGFVYGALIGAGFNWFESALYVQQNFVEFGDAPFGFQLGMRYAWLGLAGHAMFSGIFGASLGFARATRIRWLAWIAPLAGFALAVLAHAWNNSLPLFVALVAAKRGAAPPTEVARAARHGAAPGDGVRQPDEPVHLPALCSADGLDHPAERSRRASGDPRGAGRRGRPLDHRRGVPGGAGRPRLPDAPHRRPQQSRLRRAGECTARARLPQAPAARPATRPRGRIHASLDGVCRSRGCGS